MQLIRKGCKIMLRQFLEEFARSIMYVEFKQDPIVNDLLPLREEDQSKLKTSRPVRSIKILRL